MTLLLFDGASNGQGYHINLLFLSQVATWVVGVALLRHFQVVEDANRSLSKRFYLVTMGNRDDSEAISHVSDSEGGEAVYRFGRIDLITIVNSDDEQVQEMGYLNLESSQRTGDDTMVICGIHGEVEIFLLPKEQASPLFWNCHRHDDDDRKIGSKSEFTAGCTLAVRSGGDLGPTYYPSKIKWPGDFNGLDYDFRVFDSEIPDSGAQLFGSAPSGFS
ncbi:hypothetical protein NE237_020701 [Protea cynaroides]|uniref:Uncharacterized protein n=1 Tax=Protea cynaroides TaxID=273540 RepID=A0A9Q0H8X5_9MAGN|nr:hypothetical protein NE237_020701 [Protea cynaroides]